MFLLEISGLRFLEIQISDSQMNLFLNFKDIFFYTQLRNVVQFYKTWIYSDCLLSGAKMNIRAL